MKNQAPVVVLSDTMKCYDGQNDDSDRNTLFEWIESSPKLVIQIVFDKNDVRLTDKFPD